MLKYTGLVNNRWACKLRVDIVVKSLDEPHNACKIFHARERAFPLAKLQRWAVFGAIHCLTTWIHLRQKYFAHRRIRLIHTVSTIEYIVAYKYDLLNLTIADLMLRVFGLDYLWDFNATGFISTAVTQDVPVSDLLINTCNQAMSSRPHQSYHHS